MSNITQEVFDTLPEAVQGQFVLSEDTKSYVTADSLKFAGAKKNLDVLHGEVGGFKKQMADAAAAQEVRDAEIAETAYQKAIKDNDTAKLSEINEQKLQDALTRAGQSEEKFNNLQQGLATEKENTIIDALAEHATKRGKAALKRLLKGYVKVDPSTGAETYLNDDGSASSLDRNGFIAEQLKGDGTVFESLVSADIQTESEGLANGSSGSAASGQGKKTITREAFEALPHHARSKFIKDGGKIA